MRYFFYGTFREERVRARVLGPLGASLIVAPAVLEGWRRYFRRGVPSPMIARAPGRHVDGLIVEGIVGAAAKLLNAYEGELYRKRGVWVRSGPRRLRALVFVPSSTGR
jgi:hypothetical protein